MSAKRRSDIYLDAQTERALVEYARRHHFRTTSQAAAHLLRRALLAEVDEGLEGLLAPLIERRVAAAAGRAVEERVAPLLQAQSNRLAALLVKSGKDALTAAEIGVALAAQVTGDRAVARRIAEEARLKAGPAYTAPALRGRGAGEG